MLTQWINHFWNELKQPGGWILAVKGTAGAIAFFVGIVSLLAFTESHRTQVAESIHNRMANIQSGLLSDSESSRIAALRALRSFAADPAVYSVSDRGLRREAWSFARRVLLESIESSKLARSSVVGTVQQMRKSPVSAVERYELLATFEDIGNRGWDLLPMEQHLRLPSEYVLDFLWVSNLPAIQSTRTSASPSAALSGFDFENLRLDKGRFACLTLINASFDKSELEQVEFSRAQMESSSFVSAHLQYASFVGSALHAARFDDSQIIGAAFTQPGSLSAPSQSTACAAFPRTNVSSQTTSAVSATFRNSHIYESDFSGSNLPATHFDRALLSNVRFNSADLEGSAFDNAQISGTRFSSARMEGSSFASTTLTDTSFDDADLKNASFKGVRITDSNTVESLLKAKSLERTNFSGALGIEPAVLCELAKAGGVFVSNEKDWSADGRQSQGKDSYMSDADRGVLAKCST